MTDYRQVLESDFQACRDIVRLMGEPWSPEYAVENGLAPDSDPDLWCGAQYYADDDLIMYAGKDDESLEVCVLIRDKVFERPQLVLMVSEDGIPADNRIYERLWVSSVHSGKAIVERIRELAAEAHQRYPSPANDSIAAEKDDLIFPASNLLMMEEISGAIAKTIQCVYHYEVANARLCEALQSVVDGMDYIDEKIESEIQAAMALASGDIVVSPSEAVATYEQGLGKHGTTADKIPDRAIALALVAALKGLRLLQGYIERLGGEVEAVSKSDDGQLVASYMADDELSEILNLRTESDNLFGAALSVFCRERSRGHIVLKDIPQKDFDLIREGVSGHV